MQRATGQYDRLARIPGTGPRQSSGRGPFAPGYRCRATARPARGMEPTVRSARTQIRLIEKLSPGEDQPSLARARKDSQTVRTVEPVVLRAARSAWAFAASFSG